MFKKLTILTDLDDVLWDLLGEWIDELNWRHGTKVKFEDVAEWNVGKYFPSLTKDQLYAPLNEPEMWAVIRPLPEAREMLMKLIEEGHTVRVVTATFYRSVPMKITALLRLFPFLKWEDVIIAHDKSVISGDVLIDDGEHNLTGGNAPMKFLFDRPHNRSFDAEKAGIRRVGSWRELYEAIHNYAEGDT